MTKTCIAPVESLTAYFERVAAYIESGTAMCATQEDLEGHFHNCCGMVERLLVRLDSDHAAIKENLAYYPTGEIFCIDYLSWIARFDAVRSTLVSGDPQDSITALRKALKDLQSKLRQMNKALNGPSDTKVLKMYDNLCKHYNDDFLDEDQEELKSKFLSSLPRDDHRKQVKLANRRKDLEEKMAGLPMFRQLMENADDGDGFMDAFTDLLCEDRLELEPTTAAPYFFSVKNDLKGYKSYNTFFKLYNHWRVVCIRLSELEASQKDKELAEFRGKILSIVGPLEEQINPSYLSRYEGIWQSLLADKEYVELLRKPSLNDDYNSKLLLNTIGIFLTKGVLGGGISPTRQKLTPKRRDDMMRLMHYTNFDGSNSALTEGLYRKILDIID